ncbi:MAG TPA: UvrD-helicase domain-containing protein [Clostridia bacterium]|nr:UvrD-helicase domain-containing protein [Clostridia bacterium]
MSKEINKEIKWTDDQKRAIFDDGNILVSASAGSGKTAVMIERIMRLLSEGVPLSRILVVVFNNANGLELKQKITQNLIERITIADDQKRQFYRNCLDELPFSSIGTIDSFCLSLVRENFELLGTTPNADIADEPVLKNYYNIATKAMLEHFGKKGDEQFDRLVSMFGTGRNEEGLLSVILRIHELKSVQPHGDEFLSGIEKSFENLEGGNFAALILENEKDIAKKVSTYAYNLECKLRIDEQIGKADYLAYIEGVLNRIADCKTLKDLSDIYAGFEGMANMPRYTKGDRELSDMAKAVKEKFSKIMEGGKSNYSNYNLLLDAHKQNEEFFVKIAEAVRVFESNLAQAMQKDEKFSFNDIEHLAIKLLSSDQERIKKQFDYIFVDEYQDINPMQEFLINSFMAENNAFMVGDTKQSIYGFRMANPNIFLERMEHFSKNEGGKNVPLNRNFRSYDDILTFVNNIFDVIMTVGSCGIDYKSSARFEIEEKSEAENLIKINSELEKINSFEKIEVEIAAESDIATYDENEKAEFNRYENEKAEFNKYENGKSRESDIAKENDKAIQSDKVIESDKAVENDKAIENFESEAVAHKISNSNVSIHLFQKPETAKQKINGEVYKLKEHEDFDETEKAEIAEGKFIADKIKAIVGKEQHPTEDRKYDYGDIAVLCRSKGVGTTRVVETLLANGIPLDNSSLEKSEFPERELIGLLKVIDNPTPDIDFAGFLLSYFGRFDENDLAKIRIAYPLGSMYSACLSYANSAQNIENSADQLAENKLADNKMTENKLEKNKAGNKLAENQSIDIKLAQRLKNKFEFIEDYRLKSSFKNVRELLEGAVFDTAYDAYLLAKGGGELGGVMEFLSALEGKDYNESIHKFLKSYSIIQTTKKNGGVASGHLKVALKTIHKSKGLEFPIVFLINIEKQFSNKSIMGDLLLDSGGEVGILYFDEGKRIKAETISHIATKLAIRNRERREEMRLFYVALTRAKHRLYLTGVYSKNFSDNDLSDANSYLEFIGEAVRAGSLDEKLIEVVPSDNSLKSKVERRVPIFSPPDEKYLNEIKKQFEYEYPYAKATKVSQKFSVTALSNETYQNYDGAVDLFSNDEALDQSGKVLRGDKAIEKGIAYHKVMETIDYEKCSAQEIREHIASLVLSRELSKETAELIDVKEIEDCLHSDIIRLASKSFAEREKPFMMLVPLCEISDDENNKIVDDNVLVQGVIDLLIFGENEGEQVIIVDFKNSAKNEVELRKSYEKQLKIYKMAVERAISRKVDKLALYSFVTRKTIFI